MDDGSCSLLVQDFPPGCIFGIDKNTWHTGHNFKGVRCIPYGIHFIFYTCNQSESHYVNRRGFFQFFEKNEIYPIIWDTKNEDIVLNLSDEDTQRYQYSWKDFKNYTIDYPSENHFSWQRLTHHVTHETLIRIGNGRTRIFVGPEYEILATSFDKETTNEKLLRNQLNKTINEDSVTIKFMDIPKVCHPPNSTPSEISNHYIDKSYTVESLIGKRFLTQHCDGDTLEIIGEMQLAFLCFILAGAYEGFEQWKAFIITFCASDKIIDQKQSLFSSFLECLRYQLEDLPDEIINDIPNKENFLGCSLKKLYTNLQIRTQLEPNLSKKMLLLSDFLREKYNFDLNNTIHAVKDGKESSSETEEDDKPVVVDINGPLY